MTLQDFKVLVVLASFFAMEGYFVGMVSGYVWMSFTCKRNKRPLEETFKIVNKIIYVSAVVGALLGLSIFLKYR